MTILSSSALERIRSRCPCGSSVELEEHEKRTGLMNGHGIAKTLEKRFFQSRYFHEVTDRSFCSAGCALRWSEWAWKPYQAHVGG